MPLISHYIDSGAGIITLEDGDSGNRLNPERLGQLNAAFTALENDEKARFIIIRSKGQNFCLGMDLQKAAEGNDTADVKEAVKLYAVILERIHTSEKTVVVLLDGSVKAGGVGLVAACDVVLASEKTDFELSETLLGIIPANVLPYIFMLRISPQAARYLILTASRISVQKAADIGLVDEVFSSEEFEKKVKTLCKQLMRISPDAAREYKSFSNEFLTMSFPDRKKAAIDKIVEMLQKKETIEAIQGFNEGELPSWFGRFKPEQKITAVDGE